MHMKRYCKSFILKVSPSQKKILYTSLAGERKWSGVGSNVIDIHMTGCEKKCEKLKKKRLLEAVLLTFARSILRMRTKMRENIE